MTLMYIQTNHINTQVGIMQIIINKHHCKACIQRSLKFWSCLSRLIPMRSPRDAMPVSAFNFFKIHDGRRASRVRHFWAFGSALQSTLI